MGQCGIGGVGLNQKQYIIKVMTYRSGLHLVFLDSPVQIYISVLLIVDY